MQTGLHALGWGLPRLALALGITVIAAILTYTMLVFVIVVIQVAGALGL